MQNQSGRKKTPKTVPPERDGPRGMPEEFFVKFWAKTFRGHVQPALLHGAWSPGARAGANSKNLE